MSENSISKEQKAYLSSLKKRKFLIITTRLVLLALIFVFWEATTYIGWLDPFIVSSPGRIIRTVIRLLNEGGLFRHIGITCGETVAGFILGTVFGTMIAILLWASDFLSKVLEPYLVVLNSLPKIALGPVFIVWIGAGPAAIITVALTISLIVTVMEVYGGLMEVDPEKIKLVRTFGANRKQILMKVVLPGAFPTIINALKVNVGLSWVGVIVGEFLVSRAGLGYLIVYGGQVFKLDLVMTSVIILAIAAALMYQSVVWIQNTIIKHF